MTYTVVPTSYTNDLWTASNQNTYLKDNMAHVEAQGEGENTLYLSAATLWGQTGSEPGGIKVLDNGTVVTLGVPFDKDTEEFLNFLIGMPKRYDGASCHYQIWWTAEAATTGNVVWGMAMNELDDGDALGANPSAGVANVTDAWQANYDLHKTAWTEVTANGTATDDNIGLEISIKRDADNASDTLDDDACLLGVLFRWTSNVEMDD